MELVATNSYFCLREYIFKLVEKLVDLVTTKNYSIREFKYNFFVEYSRGHNYICLDQIHEFLFTSLSTRYLFIFLINRIVLGRDQIHEFVHENIIRISCDQALRKLLIVATKL